MILVIKQIGLPLRGRPILLITRMITDRIGLHSVLLPLLIIILSVFREDMTVICLLLLNIVVAAPSISFYAKVPGGVETIRTIFLFSICFQ